MRTAQEDRPRDNMENQMGKRGTEGGRDRSNQPQLTCPAFPIKDRATEFWFKIRSLSQRLANAKLQVREMFSSYTALGDVELHRKGDKNNGNGHLGGNKNPTQGGNSHSLSSPTWGQGGRAHREVTAHSKGHLSPTFTSENKSGDGVFSLLIQILVRMVFSLSHERDHVLREAHLPDCGRTAELTK